MAIIISNSNLLLNPSARQHVALLYENTQELNQAVAVYINEGLRRGQLCVYATVHYRDEGHIEHFLTLIENGKENVEKGNLLIVDLAPLYIASMIGDLSQFDNARRLFVENVRNRADKHIRFVGDGTASYSEISTLTNALWLKNGGRISRLKARISAHIKNNISMHIRIV